jgi:membrane protein DedA with SNARE-associated domain
MFSLYDLSAWCAEYAALVPLGWFVLVGSFFEELVSPIPAMFITGTAGSIALLRQEAWWYLGFLALLASGGKTVGASIYYVLGDKAEDILIGRVGKWFGVTHADIEQAGTRFASQHWKDGGALFLTRVLPFMPTTPFSLAAGIFKMDMRVYLSVTLIGYLIKDMGYLLVGYFGFAKLSTLWRDLEHVKIVFDVATAFFIGLFLFLLYRHRHDGEQAWRFACRFFQRMKC